MPKHSEKRLSPHPPELLFALVTDVERYPEFLPWVRAVRILERGENHFIAEMVICFKGLTESFTSEVACSPTHAITIKLIKGPFHHLLSHWHFRKKENATAIEFDIDFKFRSKFLEKIIGGLFSKAVNTLVSAFETRAQQQSPSQQSPA